MMNRVDVMGLCIDLLIFDSFEHLMKSAKERLGPKKFEEGKGLEDMLKKFSNALSSAKQKCQAAKLERSVEKIRLTENWLSIPKPTSLGIEALETEIRNVKETIVSDLRNRYFLIVPQDRSRYFEQVTLFGDDVNRAFPSAVQDIVEAGNCVAVECNTAAVFHLMRAAEVGLRALARDRRVGFPNGPVELQEWGKILGELRRVLSQIQQWPRTLVKEAANQFYGKALIEIEAFNQAYRTHVMHARRHYDRDEALGVMIHVEAFMKQLSTKISERKRTPLIWQKA